MSTTTTGDPNGTGGTSSHGRSVKDERYMARHSNYVGSVFEDVKSPVHLLSSLSRAALATAFFRCWHILVFFTAWATAVSLINEHVTSFQFQPTLLTVVGTVIGFVISYRTTASFERYNEGRRYWSQIVLASRTLARAIWFHVPDKCLVSYPDKEPEGTEEERANMHARMLIEKKTIINLIEAYSVAVKHYLRGEEGIGYTDLHHLVKFLPSYAYPVGFIPSSESTVNLKRSSQKDVEEEELRHEDSEEKTEMSVTETPHISLPAPVTSPTSFKDSANLRAQPSGPQIHTSILNRKPKSRKRAVSFTDHEDIELEPSSLPPKLAMLDIFPFSLLLKVVTREKRAKLQGIRAAKHKAKSAIVTKNVPLEILTYLSSYVSSLQSRNIGVPSANLLISSVSQLQDALTGLERILTTPIPFSYSIHLWIVTIIYCLALPLQIWPTLKFVTIPATATLALILFGFLVAGEEIENPFGYDLNDLDMDRFTHNIIRAELRALTSRPPPAPVKRIFSSRNDEIFFNGDVKNVDCHEHSERVTPNEWVDKGPDALKKALLNI